MDNFDSDRTNDIIEKDRKEHPNCGYSVNSSTSCSRNEEGEVVCNTLKMFQRLCPGSAPVTIFSEKEKNKQWGTAEKGSLGAFMDLDPFLGGFGVAKKLEDERKSRRSSIDDVEELWQKMAKRHSMVNEPNSRYFPRKDSSRKPPFDGEISSPVSDV